VPRATLFDQDWVELNVSGNATTPVKNDRPRAQRECPDLRSTLELGAFARFPPDGTAPTRASSSILRFAAAFPAFTVEASPKFHRLDLHSAPRRWIWPIPLDWPVGHAGVLIGPLFAGPALP